MPDLRKGLVTLEQEGCAFGIVVAAGIAVSGIDGFVECGVGLCQLRVFVD